MTDDLLGRMRPGSMFGDRLAAEPASLPLTEPQITQLYGLLTELVTKCRRRRTTWIGGREVEVDLEPRPLLRWALFALGAEVQTDNRELWAQTGAFAARVSARQLLEPWRDGSSLDVLTAMVTLAAALVDTARQSFEPAEVAALERRYPDVPYGPLLDFLRGELTRGSATRH